jgi:hypothetical protein
VIGDSSAIASPDGSALHDWSRIWILPALMSAAVLIAFALLFRDEGREPVEDA